MKIIFKISVVLFIILFFLISYLSFVGFETRRFNNQITKKVQNINKDFRIDLKEIKIILDPLKFQLNAKTIGPKLINRDKNIEFEYLKTQIPLKSLFGNNFLIKNLEISTKSLKVKSFISFIRNFYNNPEFYLLERMVKRGFLIADIKLNFDNSGKIQNNFKINGIFKDTQIDIFKKYKLDDLNFLFNYHKKTLSLKEISFDFNNLSFISKNLNIKNLNDIFEVKGDIENKDIVLEGSNIDLFTKADLGGLDIKKIEFQSKNNFSFKIDKKLKLSNLKFASKIDLGETLFSNNFKLKKYLPNINENLKLKNHKLDINYEKNNFKIKGNGEIFLQDNSDRISYLINKKEKKYDFETSIKIKENPLLIDFFNYNKNEKNELIIDLKGNKKFKDKIKFNLIAISEKSNRIEFEELDLDNNYRITSLKKAKFNFIDRENKENQFNIIKKNNSYFLEGSVFNANHLIKKIIDDDEAKSNIIDKNFEIDLKLNKLVLDKMYSLDDFKGKLSFNNQKIVNGNLVGFFSNNKKFKFTLKTIGNEKITTLFLDKAKPLISRYKFIKGFDDGTLDFYSSNKGGQSTSTLKIYDFKLKELPILTKILTLASLQGIADILSGEGIRFDEFEMNFTNKKNFMKIDEIYAIGPAISILMSGYIEKNKIISLRGTLVPATTINKAIGSIPVLGQILVGSKTGEGVFGISFKIKGPSKNLETTVNPIKTLTPRFITRTLEKIKKN